MAGSWWLDLLIGLAAGVLLAWLALIVVLIIVRPRRGMLREALRILPDLLRLLPRLAADRSLPRGVRIGLAFLLAYLASPIDIVPDFIPVIGFADDAIIVAVVLRWVVRRAGIEAIRRKWPGTEDGFAVLSRIAGLPARQDESGTPREYPARLRGAGMSKSRAARIANSEGASSRGGKKSGSGSSSKSSSKQGGTSAQKKKAGSKGGKAAAGKK